MASEENADSNPFEGLLKSEEARKQLRDIYEREHAFSSGLLQRVFLTSIVSDDMVPATNHLVQLPQLTVDMQSSRKFKCLSVENMEQALLERLQIADPRQCLHSSSKKDLHPLYSVQQATEKSVIRYLAFCYARSMLEQGDPKKVALADWSRKLIINYAVICLSTSEMFSIANPLSDFMMAFHSAFTNDKTQVPTEFFSQIILQLDEAVLQGLFVPVFQQLYQAMSDPNFSLSGNQTFTIIKTVEFLAGEPRVASILVNMPFWFPPHPVSGKSFESASFIGRMFSISCCPSNPLKQPMTFDNPVLLSKESIGIIVSSLQDKMRVYIDSLVKIVRGMFKAGQMTKLKMIEWIVECCSHNVDRTKMAEFVDPVTSIVTNFGNLASDGFFLNLTWVISRLAAPFCGSDSPQLSGVDLKYCLPSQSHSDEECGGKVIKFIGHVKMSRPPDCAEVEMEEDVSLPFHFTTHCFYMAHHCLSVGLVPVLRRYERLANASRRVQILVQRIQMSNDPSLLRALEGANVHLNLVYTLKAHLLHPQLIEAILTVYGGTADWLSQQVLKFSDPDCITTGKAFPVTDAVLCKTQHIPEALVSCLANFAMFIKKFYLDSCHISDKDCARQFVTFISIFLGNNRLVKNPHLRAELVELLSLIIPQDDSDSKKQTATSALFHSHKLASDLLIKVLLQLFVDIENSGDNEINIAFKFGYRLPIYDVLKYLWQFPEYQDSINVLCEESDTETEPPVFLKFLNLMVNDSTLLLDLAFENLTKVRTIELEKKAGNWNNLSAQEKQEKEEQLAEASHIARITNLLARKTVHTFTFLTASTPGPFITETMVDKIASTLNYYLYQLVGPKQKELKVEDFERYSFRPDLLVSDIVTVYINLSFNQSFCEAIPRDGRSYSPELFSQAERILKVLRKPPVMIMQLNQFAMKVKEAASALENMETNMGDVPEEFLDPVLGTVMNDPVILPNSKVTLDRTTIVRHLLSDATDPFTRAPLTMDQVIPNTELKQQIETWKNNLHT